MNAPFALKPQLADDADLSLLQLPCWGMPKIDGVRGLNLSPTFTGRSLDPFEGFGITERFSGEQYLGLDSEATLGDDITAPRLCSLTTGAMGRFVDVTEMADIHRWVFDLDRQETLAMPYEERYFEAQAVVQALADPRIHLVPYVILESIEQVAAYVGQNLEQGLEGTIIRNPKALRKSGKPTKKNWEFMRVKPFGDFEILVTGLTEGAKNTNEAKKNSLGNTERSSSKGGLVPNGQVGSIQGTMVADVHCPFTKKFLFPKGMPVTISPGKMTVAEATDYWQHPEKIVGHYAKAQHMTYGVKDLPRSATFQTLRLKQDMS
jgi:DNA ligase-1